jgi:hypothetical protein
MQTGRSKRGRREVREKPHEMRHFRSLRARRRESLAVPGELEWFIIERIKKAATEVAGCTIEVWQEAKMEVLLH